MGSKFLLKGEKYGKLLKVLTVLKVSLEQKFLSTWKKLIYNL